jgi:hypothetical protein
VSHDDIMAVMRADPSDAKAKNLGNKVSATLAILCDASKLKRTGERFCYRYERTAKTLQVPRAQKPATTAKPKAVTRVKRVDKPAALPPAKAVKPPPAVVSKLPAKAVARPAPTPVKHPVDRPAPFVVPNANLTRPRTAALDSEQIARDIAAFEARGGCIQRFKPGESSQSLREQNDAYLAARGQGVAKQKAAARIATRARASNDETLDADDQADVA